MATLTDDTLRFEANIFLRCCQDAMTVYVIFLLLDLRVVIVMDGTVFPGVRHIVMAPLFVYLPLSFEVIAPRSSNRTMSLINRCDMEAGKRTAEYYLVHGLPNDLKELIYPFRLIFGWNFSVCQVHCFDRIWSVR